MNRIYRLMYFKHRESALRDMEVTISNLKRDLKEFQVFPVKINAANGAVSNFMRTFKFEDSFFHFKPTIELFFMKKHIGYCYWAAVAAKWAFEVLGTKADIYILTRKGGSSHAVCIPDTRDIVVDNGIFRNIERDDIFTVINRENKTNYTKIFNESGKRINACHLDLDLVLDSNS